jgi:adenine-specific DNA methylase
LRRAHEYKAAPVDQILEGDKVVRISNVSLPLEREIVDSWVEFSGKTNAAYVATVDAGRTDIPDEAVDLVVTDPPYMDNVHYSELADFFHAWLKGLGPHSSYPEGDYSTRREGEVQSPSPDGFQRAITAVWRECARVLKHDGLLAFTFHQARVEGWAALVSALADAGFVITAIQPVKGEMSTSSTKHGKEPSNLDSIIVCRKMATSKYDTTSVESVEAAEAKLADLSRSGVSVGAGDVRSVVRGHVLAAYTRSPSDSSLGLLVEEADALAAAAVERHIGAAA